MIGQTPEKIALEIEHGVRERDKKLNVFKQQVMGYVGPYFESDEADEEYNPENHVYEFLSFTVPQLAYNNPRFSMKSRVYGTDKDVNLMRWWVDTWSQDTAFGELLIPSAHDFCFNFAAGVTTRENHPFLKLETGLPAKTCKFKRLSQRHYVRDPGALTMSEARWEAHEWHMDKEDLIRMAESQPDAGWDLEVIKSLPEYQDADASSKHSNKVPDRKQVRCYSFWVKDAVMEDAEALGFTQEEGFHGVYFTLAAYKEDGASTMEFIREPYPFYGPAEGPYSFGWAYYVPDDAYGLSPLVAVEGQVRDLNVQARAMIRRSVNRKRPVFVDEMVEDSIAQKLQDAVDDEVIGIAGFDSSKISGQEIGGITDQDLSLNQITRERLERVSGLSEQQRGIAGNADSATEAAIAKEGGDLRMEWNKVQFQRFVRSPARIVAWYAHNDNEMRMVLPPEAAMEIGIPVPPGEYLIVEGGSPSMPFELMGLEVEPMSMERTSTASNQRRATEMFGLVTQIAQLIPTMPWVRWGDLLDQMGDAYNVPRMGELIDFQMASMAAMAPIMPGQNSPQGVTMQSRPGGLPGPSQAQGQRAPSGPANAVLQGSPFSGFKQGQMARGAMTQQ